MRNDDESIAHVREVANNEGVIRIIVRPSGVDDTLGAAPMNPDIVFQTKAFVKRMTANDVKEPKRSEQDLHDAAEAFKERQRLTREIAESLMIDQNTIDIDKFEAYCSLQQTPEEIEFAQVFTQCICVDVLGCPITVTHCHHRLDQAPVHNQQGDKHRNR